MAPEKLLQKLIARENLDAEEMREFVETLMAGGLEPALVGAVLAALAAKGETVDELVGAAQALRAHAVAVQLPAGVAAIDTCGTGGDGQPLFNVSTAAAIVAAAAGATVAKHGNRSNARPSGSAEAIAALGVNVDATPACVEECLRRCRVGFLYAAKLHPAMKHAAPVRRALGVRTIFNLVGPLANPAGVRRQLVGVNKLEMVDPMIDALRRLGAERAMVVHGLEGLCDISIAGPTCTARWDGEWVTMQDVEPGAIGIEPMDLRTLYISGPEESARVIRGVLEGQGGAAREMVVFNAAAALWVAGLASDLGEGAEQARAAIDGGRAAETLRTWVETSRRG